MSQFLEDLRQKKSLAGALLGLAIGALALGSVVPFLFDYLAGKFSWVSLVLSVEANELGLNVVYFPVGMMGITAFCLILEASLLGYERSTAKKILANEMPSVRTDVFYLLFRISGLMMIFSLAFSFGSLYVATDFIKSELGFAFLADVDSVVVQFVAWVLIFTFLNYWAHRLLHTRFFWDIHQVHHSAEHYNVLLPYRNHPVEYIVATLYGIGATAVLGIKPEVMMAWLAANAVYQSMVHSQYDWKWRWVEYVLITPAAHRIHHSTAPEHFNSNLAILSIWDRMFGTYVPPTEEPINFGVPEQKNFNTDRYFTEIIACFLRWLSIKRGTSQRTL